MLKVHFKNKADPVYEASDAWRGSEEYVFTALTEEQFIVITFLFELKIP